MGVAARHRAVGDRAFAVRQALPIVQRLPPGVVDHRGICRDFTIDPFRGTHMMLAAAGVAVLGAIASGLAR